MRIPRFKISWGEFSPSVFCLISLSTDTWIGCLFGLWLHDSIDREMNCFVTCYVEFLFMEFKVLKIQV